jgi:hypothetical protein
MEGTAERPDHVALNNCVPEEAAYLEAWLECAPDDAREPARALAASLAPRNVAGARDAGLSRESL